MTEIDLPIRAMKGTWWARVSQPVCLVLAALLLWAVGYSLLPEHVGPNSQLLSLAVGACEKGRAHLYHVLFITGKLAGVLVGLLKLPPLLGMLAMGVLLRNVGFLDLSDNYKDFTAILRQLSLVNILVPAGLGLDPDALRRMSGFVLSLALGPPIIEVLIMMLVSYYLLALPWLWALLLGLLMGAVSPAVIIPCLFELQDLGYGVDKGIHTLVIAASTLDDIACIAGFGIVIGIIFSTGSLLMQILEGPIVIVMGFTYGIIFGLIAQYIPHPKDEYVVTWRTLLLALGCILATVGSQAVGYSGAGTLGVIVSAFVACLGWRRQGWTSTNPVKTNFSLAWRFLEPVSFTLIGMEVDLSVLQGGVVLWGSLCMTIALLARMVTSVAITSRTKLNFKETVFVAISSIPKATVQAALGPMALDYARMEGSVEAQGYATVLLVVAVLSIILTSPLGALLIMQGGPRLLNRTQQQGHDNPALEPDSLDTISTNGKWSSYNTI